MRYTKQYHDCLVALWKWRKSIRGPGVRNTFSGVTIAPPPGSRGQPQPDEDDDSIIPVLLKQDGGTYNYGTVSPAPVDGRTYSLYSLSGTLLQIKTPLSTPREIPNCEYTAAAFGLAVEMTAAEIVAANTTFFAGTVSGYGFNSGFAAGGTVAGSLVLIRAFEAAGDVQECDAESSE